MKFQRPLGNNKYANKKFNEQKSKKEWITKDKDNIIKIKGQIIFEVETEAFVYVCVCVQQFITTDDGKHLLR